MSLRNAKIIFIGAVVLGSLMALLVIRHQVQAKLRQREEILRQQAHQCAELGAEYLRLSNQLAQAQSTPVDDRMAELIKLRSEANVLRKHTNEIAKQTAENRQSAAKRTPLKLKTTVSKPGPFYVVSDSDSEEYALQLRKMAAGERNRYTGDARNLSYAVREYSREHQGEVPSTFAEAAPHKWKGELPLAGSFKGRDTMAGANDFEIVYHGSLNEIANIPEQAVALIRQREPWPTPNGKWARIYAMADGRIYAVESDDNFQAWEAEHIIPPGQ